MSIYLDEYYDNPHYIFYLIKDRDYDILNIVYDKRKIKIPHLKQQPSVMTPQNVHDLNKAFKYILDYTNKKKTEYEENTRKAWEEKYEKDREYTEEIPQPNIERPTRTLPRMDDTDTSTFDNYSPKHINRLNEGDFTVKPFNLECKNCGYKGEERKFTKVFKKKPACPKCKSEDVAREKTERPKVYSAPQAKRS